MYTRLVLVTYVRPDELLGVRRCDLVAPMAGITHRKGVEAELVPTKTSQYDDSVMLDMTWLE